MALDIVQGSARTLPDRVADELIARVFTGELCAGELLPPERTLAIELGVDRTSLRMALRQLTRMKLMRAARGSGITVLDYRKHAGIDFLAAVLEISGLELGGAFLLEALDHWIAAMPALVARAFARATPADVRGLDARFAVQLKLIENGAALDQVVEVELDIQDALIALVGSTALDLLANSTRGLRRKLGRMLLDFVDARELVKRQRAQVRSVLKGPQRTDARDLAEAHRRYLIALNAPLRRHLASLPPNPSRRATWPRAARKASRTGIKRGKA
jgi:GntR family transcriptional regulator, transcriptional repressor for pyruvate dehydrogenase complex